MYKNVYTIYNSIKFNEIVKLNKKFIFRSRNNVLPKNLQLF